MDQEQPVGQPTEQQHHHQEQDQQQDQQASTAIITTTAATKNGDNSTTPTENDGGMDDNEEEPIDINQFYLRYYVGHQDDNFGHEFLEFELREDGTLRYANNSQYKKDILIRKSVKLGVPLVEWVKERIAASQIVDVDDSNWPVPDDLGRQEIEIKINGVHIYFVTGKISSMAQLNQLPGAESLKIFYDLTHDLKQWFFDIIGLHFRLKNI